MLCYAIRYFADATYAKMPIAELLRAEAIKDADYAR